MDGTKGDGTIKFISKKEYSTLDAFYKCSDNYLEPKSCSNEWIVDDCSKWEYRTPCSGEYYPGKFAEEP